jgi:hypothetical protein
LAGRVFISYSRADEDYVSELVLFLEAQGLQPWIDREQIGSGDRWARMIQDEIDKCAAMVVVMTPSSDDSKWVKNEIQRAIVKNKAILPLLLKGDLGFFELGTSHFDDVRNGDLPSDLFVRRLWQLTGMKPREVVRAPKGGWLGALPSYKVFMPALLADRGHKPLTIIGRATAALVVTEILTAAVIAAVLPPSWLWVVRGVVATTAFAFAAAMAAASVMGVRHWRAVTRYRDVGLATVAPPPGPRGKTWVPVDVYLGSPRAFALAIILGSVVGATLRVDGFAGPATAALITAHSTAVASLILIRVSVYGASVVSNVARQLIVILLAGSLVVATTLAMTGVGLPSPDWTQPFVLGAAALAAAFVWQACHAVRERVRDILLIQAWGGWYLVLCLFVAGFGVRTRPHEHLYYG